MFDRRWTEVDVLRALAATDAVRCGPELVNVLYESVLCADGERRPAALMELGVLGRSLRAWLSERGTAGLDADDRLRVIVLVVGMCAAIARGAFHSRRLHGDIYQANEGRRRNDASPIGSISRLLRDGGVVGRRRAEHCMHGLAGGTKYYVAPEVADRERYSQSADAWSLGRDVVVVVVRRRDATRRRVLFDVVNGG